MIIMAMSQRTRLPNVSHHVEHRRIDDHTAAAIPSHPLDERLAERHEVRFGRRGLDARNRMRA